MAAIAFFEMAYLGASANPLTTFDYLAYQNIYNQISVGANTRVEWLYKLCSQVAISFGLDYLSFRTILVFVIFLILYIAAARISQSLSLFAGLFMVIPFFQEVTQIRSFAAYTLAIFGMTYLTNLTKKRLIIYFLIIIFAMGFHTSAGVFLLVPIIQKLIDRVGIFKVFKISSMVSFLFALLLIISSKASLVINVIASIVGATAGKVIENTFITLMASSGGSKQYFIIVYILYEVIIYQIVKLKNLSKDTEINKFNFLFAGMILGLLLSPTLIISTQFNRVQRLGIELALLLISYVFPKLRKSKSANCRFLVILISLFMIAGAFYGFYSSEDQFESSIPYLLHLEN